MARTEVLIVGAGPTGLMMACQLAMRGIDFRIIDKTADHTTQSRALVIHARSLEILQQMGIEEQALKQGNIARAVNLVINGKRKIRLPFGIIGKGLTDFPFLLILEQSKTEAILSEFMGRYGIQVERNTELTSFSQRPDGITAVVTNDTGVRETIEAGWLIGADGAHSIVREGLDIPFIGKTYKQSLYVLDCEADLDFTPNEVFVTLSDRTIAAFFPMTNGRYRLIGLVPEEAQDKEELTFEDINKNFAANTRLDVRLFNPEWISRYHSHHRVVSTFRQGRCFLAGDAAHIHSPIGGQGMNTGLQDAYNLAWKLALVIRGKADDSLLDTYHEERMTVARRLVKTTDRAFHIVAGKNRLRMFIRVYIFPYLLKLFLPIVALLPGLRKWMFTNVSEIAIRYRYSRLSCQDPASRFPSSAPKPGDRLPYNPLWKTFTAGTGFHLLLFSKNPLPDSIYERFAEACRPLEDEITVVTVPFKKDTASIYRQFGISDAGFYFIRPDGHIAYRSSKLEATKLGEYLREWF